jgi:hypothetical protein
MTRDEIRATALRTLGTIAPEADLATLAPDVRFGISSTWIRWAC